MPTLLNPFLSFGSGGNTVVDLTEPWGEAARQTSLSSGALVLSGYDLSGLQVVQFHISGVTVTTDDSTVGLQFFIDGSLVTTGYRYTVSFKDAAGNANTSVSQNASSILLTSATATDGVGNAATESFSATVTVYNPSSASHHKRCYIRSSYLTPAGNIANMNGGAGQLNTTGAVTGIKVIGSSNLTAGSIIALGVE